MSVLSQLVDDAASDVVPTAVLLRRMKVIAVRLKTAPLARWVQNEVDGYGPDETLPDYRGPFAIDPLGHFTGGFGSEITNGKMPQVLIDESVRSSFDQFYFVDLRQGVATLEDMRGTHMGVQWPSDAIAFVNTLIRSGKIRWYEAMYLASAHTPIPAQVLVGAIDAVRTRLLDLALGIEEKDPLAGDPLAATIAPSTVTNIFKTVVHGGNVAVGSADFQQIIATRPESLHDLLDRLGSVGVPVDLLDELRTAVELDGDVSDQPGEQVTGWLGRAATWAGTQASNSGSGALGGVIAQAVLMYLGLAQ